MIEFTPAAQRRLDTYFHQLRFILRGARSMDPADVERDVLEHIEAELAARPQPIDFTPLDEVLRRLGSPRQWISLDDLPAWRRVLIHLRFGAEDWGLAYVTFACFIFGAMLVVLPPVGFALLLASFLLARAAVALSDEKTELLGPQRWLVYPPLVPWYLALLGAWFFFPIAGAVVSVHELWLQNHYGTVRGLPPVPPGMELATAGGASVAAAGLMLGLLALIGFIWPRAVRAIFRPFAAWWGRVWALSLVVVAALLVTAGVSMMMLGPEGLGINELSPRVQHRLNLR